MSTLSIGECEKILDDVINHDYMGSIPVDVFVHILDIYIRRYACIQNNPRMADLRLYMTTSRLKRDMQVMPKIKTVRNVQMIYFDGMNVTHGQGVRSDYDLPITSIKDIEIKNPRIYVRTNFGQTYIFWFIWHLPITGRVLEETRNMLKDNLTCP